MQTQVTQTLSLVTLLAFAMCSASQAQSDSPSALKKESIQFAALPFPITSFGAARIDDKVYVYGGHMGGAHAYFNEDQSNKLLTLDLASQDGSWKEVSTGERLQGLGMVAYKDDLIIVGGFTARNKKGEKQDLHSSSNVRAFNTKSGSWRDLPGLPEPRSSHDAAIIGSTVYVVGGWNLQGEGQTEWHTTAWSLDLSQPELKWSKLPDQPFQRRALATVEHAGRLFVIGGMNKDGGPTKAVSIYDPQSKAWSEAPDIIGDKAMAGFGAAGWSFGGRLIVSTYEGALLEWNDAKKEWSSIGKTNDARFFHRLIPLSDGKLIAIGGASMESGKFVDPEVIDIN